MNNPTTEQITTIALTFAWWNTALVPAGKSRGIDMSEHRKTIGSVIRSLIADIKADFIALCEITVNEFEHIRKELALDGWIFFANQSDVGGPIFDLCYLFKADAFELLHAFDITSNDYIGSAKVAQRLTFIEKITGEPICIFASHWPSLLNVAPDDYRRHHLASTLRDWVLKTKDGSENIIKSIMMGDYNAEPYDKHMQEHLFTSRHRELATKRENMFYNPTWSLLVEDPRGHKGTYYYSGGVFAKWLAFDQIFVTSSLLKGDSWKLSHQSHMVPDMLDLRKLIRSAKSKFDHMPIYVTIERVI